MCWLFCTSEAGWTWMVCMYMFRLCAPSSSILVFLFYARTHARFFHCGSFNLASAADFGDVCVACTAGILWCPANDHRRQICDGLAARIFIISGTKKDLPPFLCLMPLQIFGGWVREVGKLVYVRSVRVRRMKSPKTTYTFTYTCVFRFIVYCNGSLS